MQSIRVTGHKFEGALFAGLAFSRDSSAVHSDSGFAYFYEFFTPFFCIYIGM
jgi:Kef-type K+ transport system membrane component KefB